MKLPEGFDPAVADAVRTARRVAVVGLSSKPERASHGVAAYLQSQGLEIIPVNPMETEVLGVPAVARLEDVEGPVDIVDVFRRSEETPDIARSAVAIGARCLWMQNGVINEESARIAREGGVAVVMDKCLAVLYPVIVQAD